MTAQEALALSTRKINHVIVDAIEDSAKHNKKNNIMKTIRNYVCRLFRRDVGMEGGINPIKYYHVCEHEAKVKNSENGLFQKYCGKCGKPL